MKVTHLDNQYGCSLLTCEWQRGAIPWCAEPKRHHWLLQPFYSSIAYSTTAERRKQGVQISRRQWRSTSECEICAADIPEVLWRRSKLGLMGQRSRGAVLGSTSVLEMNSFSMVRRRWNWTRRMLTRLARSTAGLYIEPFNWSWSTNRGVLSFGYRKDGGNLTCKEWSCQARVGSLWIDMNDYASWSFKYCLDNVPENHFRGILIVPWLFELIWYKNSLSTSQVRETTSI